MSHADWLRYRTMGIGGSDVSVIAGINPYKSAYQLWLEKTGQTEPAEIENEYTHFGTVLEPVIRREFMERTGLKVRQKHMLLQSEEHPFMLANLDGVVKVNGEMCIFEAKTASAYKLDEWQSGIPPEYMLQVQHYMAVTGMSSAYVAVLLGGNQFEIQKIDRDEDMIQHIIQMEEHFWYEYMLKDTPPEATAKDNEILGQLYPKSEEKAIELPTTARDILTDYEKACHDLALAKEAKEQAEAKLKMMLADAEVGIIDGYKISWKNVSTTRLDSKKVKSLLTEDQLKECSNTTMSRKFTIGARKK